MVHREELVDQLIRLVDVRLLDPLEILVDEIGRTRTIDAVRGLVRTRASSWARDLLGDDEQRALYVATRLVMALYPSDGPFDPPLEWWRTPLGRVYLLRAGYPGGEGVPLPVAAAALRTTVPALAALKLKLHPGGGIDLEALRARLTGKYGHRPAAHRPDDDDIPPYQVGGPPAEPEP